MEPDEELLPELLPEVLLVEPELEEPLLMFAPPLLLLTYEEVLLDEEDLPLP